jgi:hypothetical protein
MSPKRHSILFYSILFYYLVKFLEGVKHIYLGITSGLCAIILRSYLLEYWQ